MVMEDIDLGDRRGLIDLIYGPQKGVDSTTPSVNTITPLTENEKNERKEKSRVICSFSTAFFLFLLAAAAIFLSGFASYWVTKQEYERKLALPIFIPEPRRNLSLLMGEPEEYEEDEPIEGPKSEELKLPSSLEPIWYIVTIKPYLPGYVPILKEKNLTTEGHALIKIKAKKDTSQIVLNAKELSFPSDLLKVKILLDIEDNRVSREPTANMTKITDSPLIEDPQTTKIMRKEYADSGIRVKAITINSTLEQVTFSLDKNIQAGDEIILQLPFNGHIGNNLKGLSISTYKSKDTRTRNLAITHMEPINARSFVPCFDEPHMKATWKMNVIHPKGTIARSNSLETEDAVPTPDSNWVMTSFEESNLLSSYLTALIISDFHAKEAMTKSGIKVRVWAQPDAVNMTNYALEIAVKALDVLEEYFGIPLNTKKQDLFAVPDFEQGAMENLGLMIFHEHELLYDSKLDTIADKITVLQRIAHEVSHQWFGNLVTLSSWNDLWINKAFANYMEYITMDKLLSGNVQMLDYQIVDSVEPALRADAQASSHPLTTRIETASDTYEIFDRVTYDKGASLIRMIKAIIGEENFRKGIQNYLKKYQNSNANHTQLWDALNEVLPVDLKAWNGEKFNMADFANKWILQMGYPVLDIYRIDSHTVEITQRRFKMDHLTPEKAKYRNALFWYKWEVPLFIEVNGQKQKMQWLHEAFRQPLNLTDTLIINSDSFGFYRVNYDERGWNQIADQLNKDHTKLLPTTRARVLSDALALAQAGQIPYELALNLTAYLPRETELLPWAVALEGLEALSDKLEELEISDEMTKFIMEKISPIFDSTDINNLQFTEEGQFFDSRIKEGIVRLYCKLSPRKCAKKLVSQFNSNLVDKCEGSAYSSQCSTVPLDLRPLSYCEGVARGAEEEFDRVHQFMMDEIHSGEKIRLIRALGCSRDPRVLRRILHESLDRTKSSLQRQNLYYLVASMNEQPVGREVLTDFIIDNWKSIIKNLSSDQDVLESLLKQGLRISSQREIKEVERFLIDHKSSTRAFGSFKSHLEIARSSVHWLKTSKKQLEDYFDGRRIWKEL